MTSARISKAPLQIDKAVTCLVGSETVTIKGAKGELTLALHASVFVELNGDELLVRYREPTAQAIAIAGATYRNLQNMQQGVTKGYERRLKMVGVGYRAQVQGGGTSLNVSAGYSHPVEYRLPVGVAADVVNQTEIVISGIDKQRVGQVAAEIRAIRRPERYKGKGIRYVEEVIELKETKKK